MDSDKHDVIILGAGIIGVCTALHLQAHGRRVLLVDRNDPGMGTSYGNAGLIERSGIIPYAFPRSLRRLAGYALNRRADVYYQTNALPRMAPWLWSYWVESGSKRLAQATADLLPLIEHSVSEHDALAGDANVTNLFEARGWIEVYRSRRRFGSAQRDAEALRQYDIHYDVLDGDALRDREPGLTSAVVGGVHWLDPKTVTDPRALVQGYADLFRKRGGWFAHGDAGTLEKTRDDWAVTLADGKRHHAIQVVVALGPDSRQLTDRLGYRFPLALKRGYHLHFRERPDTTPLTHAVCDADGGYVLAPMRQGLRLTTGIELAREDAPPCTVQIKREQAIAQTIHRLGNPVESTPWMGRRPCFPDMRPVIGPAPKHPGLWLHFGHAHHGLTLGPASGRLLAEMMTGTTPYADPAPFSPLRFY